MKIRRNHLCLNPQIPVVLRPRANTKGKTGGDAKPAEPQDHRGG
jgi:hypothetical protein